MRHITGVDCPRKNYLVIHYWEDGEPDWIDGRKLSIYLRADPTVKRLVNLTSRIFELLLNQPEMLASPDEALQEWLLRIWEEEGRPENHGVPGVAGGKA